MANIAKFNIIKCGHMFKHYERGVGSGNYSNSDIDKQRSHLNENLCKAERPKQIDYLRHMLSLIKHSTRKDLVCMCSVIVAAPTTLKEELHDIFFKLVYDFLVERYGSISGFKNHEDIVISCYRHKDESTDHIHFAFCPIIGDDETNQRFCAKEVICRNDLRTLHQDLSRYLADNGCCADILNGKTQRDSYGKALTIKQLKKNRDIERTVDRWDNSTGGRERNRERW